MEDEILTAPQAESTAEVATKDPARPEGIFL